MHICFELYTDNGKLQKTQDVLLYLHIKSLLLYDIRANRKGKGKKKKSREGRFLTLHIYY